MDCRKGSDMTDWVTFHFLSHNLADINLVLFDPHEKSRKPQSPPNSNPITQFPNIKTKKSNELALQKMFQKNKL